MTSSSSSRITSRNSSNGLPDWILPVAGCVASAATTAVVTYAWTKRREDARHRARVVRQLEREKLLQKKTQEARQEAHRPPSGKLLADVQLDHIYLWECQDLRKYFPSAQVENVMQFQINPVTASINHNKSAKKNAPQSSSSSSRPTPYNKLITDHECILASVVRKPNMHTHTVSYMRAGPRRYLHFDPQQIQAVAIVTCGGLCPGLNNVIREITKSIRQLYGVTNGKVYGIKGGYRGFYDPAYLPPVELTPELVEGIHHEGGTVLGSSRGGFDIDKILAFLKEYQISHLYVIGGDGTHRGAFRIHEECMAKGLNIAVAGIPKTIDNDIDYIDHSFGFSSAVEAAQVAIRSAKTEAMCNLPNGIGIVKLMGRSAGFIAAHATMSSADVDLCLVPEVPIVLEGPDGCLPHLMRRVQQQGYAVVVVAEGAGEDLVSNQSSATDASGNKKLPAIGEFMKTSIAEYFERQGQTATVKYIDPSYTVRSVPANAADSLYCMQLAQNAVHGAMAGYTGFSIGLCNNRMVFLPIPELVATSPRCMNPHGRTWERVLALTRQPNTAPPKDPASKSYDSHAPILR